MGLRTGQYRVRPVLHGGDDAGVGDPSASGPGLLVCAFLRGAVHLHAPIDGGDPEQQEDKRHDEEDGQKPRDEQAEEEHEDADAQQDRPAQLALQEARLQLLNGAGVLEFDFRRVQLGVAGEITLGHTMVNDLQPSLSVMLDRAGLKIKAIALLHPPGRVERHTGFLVVISFELVEAELRAHWDITGDVALLVVGEFHLQSLPSLPLEGLDNPHFAVPAQSRDPVPLVVGVLVNGDVVSHHPGFHRTPYINPAPTCEF